MAIPRERSWHEPPECRGTDGDLGRQGILSEGVGGQSERSRRSVQAEILSEKGVIIRRPLLKSGLPHSRGQHPPLLSAPHPPHPNPAYLQAEL